MFQKANVTLLGCIVYVLLVVAPAPLKFVGLAPFATLTWLQATALMWAPWLLAVASWLLLGAVSIGERLWLGKIKVANDLTVSGS
jgi:hypothetical protein